MMKKAAALILCFLVQSVWTLGQQKGFVRGELGERVDDLLINFSREGYSGSALVVRNGEIILHKGYGWADRERRVPNTPQTLFNVASVGKTFTAAAVLKLE